MSAYPAMRQLPAGLTLSIAFVLVTSPCILAATIVVPDDLPTIQGAILAAADGDTVLVQPGTYLENINYRGKAIALIAPGGPAVTTIDGSSSVDPDSATVVTIPEVAGPGLPILEGFTITGGGGTRVNCTRRGGGVLMRNAAIVRGNDITENHLLVDCDVVGSLGGGIDMATFGPTVISHNRIFSNSVRRGALEGGPRGGGVRIQAGEGVLSHNEIFDNVAGFTPGNGSGGGIHVEGIATMIFEHNVIACNVAARLGGGIYSAADVVRNNTIVANEAMLVPLAAGVGGAEGSLDNFERNAITHNLGGGADCSDPTGDCNNFFGNTMGDPDCLASNPTNISEDPLYADDDCGDAFCLQAGSPMLPENSPPGCGLIGARGLCGQTTSVSGDGAPGATRSGLRAYPNPFNPSTTVAFELGRAGQVTLEIVTTGGRKVARVLDARLEAGPHQVRWDGRRADGTTASSGAYIVVLHSGSESRAQKVLLLK